MVRGIQHLLHRNLGHRDGFRFGQQFHLVFERFVRQRFGFAAVNKNRQEQQQQRMKHDRHEKAQDSFGNRDERGVRFVLARGLARVQSFSDLLSLGEAGHN